MGKHSAPIVRNWVTGRDIHTLLDAGFSEWWLANYPGVKDL
jgi:N-acylneuraminate cytidylyltransferase